MNSLIKRLKENNVCFYDYKNIDVGQFLGEGGFSSVYKCTIKGKLYAAKRLYFEFDDSFNEFKSNLFKEFMLSKQLNSKRFTKIYGFSYDYDEDEFYIIMEYLNNGDFHTYLNKCCFTYQEKLKIFNSLVLAVKTLHEKDYIHRDLKMDNISYHMDHMNNKKYMKLFDYNFMIKGKKDPNKLTYGCAITKGYSSPESYSDEEQVCKKSDIYSLGVIFLEFILEHDLWSKSTNLYNCDKSVRRYLKKYSKTNPELSRIIEICLSEDIKQRFTADELYKEIKVLIK